MNKERINIIIKQLEQIERESFSPQNDKLFKKKKKILI